MDEKLSAIDRGLLTVLWSAKESLFKWYSLGKVDFRENMQLIQPIQKNREHLLLPFVFNKSEPVYLTIIARIFDEIVLSWVI